jgi:predicted pyridoxine 5'-phosphate oxidase superfamily flavin-nucleotide-binding protein
MTRRYTDITFTDSVKETQTRYGTRRNARKVENWAVDDRHLSPREIEFIAGRDSFYQASVGDDGWPYVQFRGGPKGFLKVLGSNRLAYADFRGNLQYISVGNIAHDDRVALFLMDYPSRRRLKIMARASVVDAADDPELVAQLEVPGYKAVVERAVVLQLEAFDWNCAQHITPRYTSEEWQALTGGTDIPEAVAAGCET